MRALRLFTFSLIACFVSCKRSEAEREQLQKCECCSAIDLKTRGALLGTRFHSFEELQSAVQIKYFPDNPASKATEDKSAVRISHCSNGMEVVCFMKQGVSQQDIWNARYDKSWNRFLSRIALLFRAPWVVAHRRDLQRVYTLSRWRPEWFGEGDVAFYDIAKAMADNINTFDLAYKNERDSTEKGYLNSFNHITAQAIVTSCFSQELADFIADAHERYSHPELITGSFTQKQIEDLAEGPVDNYVDVINNEWGQELGKQLKEKYNITQETEWTPELLANYLNDMQGYYCWAFAISFEPFRADDEIIRKFSNKIQRVMHDKQG